MDNNTAITTPTPRKITSLSDFVADQDRTYPLIVTYQEDVLEFEIKLLSAYEWQSCEWSEPYPERIVLHHSKTGPVYDFDHPDYQRGLRERHNRINLKRLVKCICADIPGDTLDAKATYLNEHLPFGLLSSMVTRLIVIHSEGEARIDTRAGAFQQNGAQTNAGDGKAGDDTPAVVELAETGTG